MPIWDLSQRLHRSERSTLRLKTALQWVDANLTAKHARPSRAELKSPVIVTGSLDCCINSMAVSVPHCGIEDTLYGIMLKLQLMYLLLATATCLPLASQP